MKRISVKELEALQTKVIARAWKDPAFKKKLLSNPKATLQEMGYPIPDNITVRIQEDHGNTFTFVLPAAPNASLHLSESELERLAAAGTATIPKVITVINPT